MVIGLGCDFIEVERFRKAMARAGIRLVQRLFSEEEILYCSKRADPVLNFAGRFVAKEALAKALGVGIGTKLAWHDMEIVNDPAGCPHVVWHIDVIALFGVTSTRVSISHSHFAAMAVAILE